MARWSCRWTLLVATLLLTACGVEGPALKSPAAPPSTSPEPATEISTSTWEPGDPGRDALIMGELRFTREGCPYLGSPAHRQWVIWPAGYAARVQPDGGVVLVTADGRVMSEGDRVEAGGVAAGLPASARPCIPDGAIETIIQSEVLIRDRP